MTLSSSYIMCVYLTLFVTVCVCHTCLLKATCLLACLLVTCPVCNRRCASDFGLRRHVCGYTTVHKELGSSSSTSTDHQNNVKLCCYMNESVFMKNIRRLSECAEAELLLFLTPRDQQDWKSEDTAAYGPQWRHQDLVRGGARS